MSAIMPISHRLFAAALRDGMDDRKPKSRAEKSAIIEMPREVEVPAWIAARQMPRPMSQGWSARVGV
jgi:hypothetical protein